MKLKYARVIKTGDELDLEDSPFLHEEDELEEAAESYIRVEWISPPMVDDCVEIGLCNMNPINVPASYKLKVVEDDD